MHSIHLSIDWQDLSSLHQLLHTCGCPTFTHCHARLGCLQPWPPHKVDRYCSIAQSIAHRGKRHLSVVLASREDLFGTFVVSRTSASSSKSKAVPSVFVVYYAPKALFKSLRPLSDTLLQGGPAAPQFFSPVILALTGLGLRHDFHFALASSVNRRGGNVTSSESHFDGSSSPGSDKDAS